MIFQTRSEDTGLISHESIKEALREAKADRTIWKISFGLPNNERIRLIRYAEDDRWILELVEN